MSRIKKKCLFSEAHKTSAHRYIPAFCRQDGRSFGKKKKKKREFILAPGPKPRDEIAVQSSGPTQLIKMDLIAPLSPEIGRMFEKRFLFTPDVMIIMMREN